MNLPIQQYHLLRKLASIQMLLQMEYVYFQK
nr:MAG TPA: hypothetical protein [Caudoviricetes sp.]